MAIEVPHISKSRAVEAIMIGASATAGLLILEKRVKEARVKKVGQIVLFERSKRMRDATNEDGNYGAIGSEEQTAKLDEAYFV